MPADEVFIALHADAPPKPGHGARCNGCGACCAASPCPLSRFLLDHRHGTCPALVWQEGKGRYTCGMVDAPAAHLTWLPPAAQAVFGRLARRWIAADAGCDFDAEFLDIDSG